MGCCRHSKPVPKFPPALAESPPRRRRRKQQTPTSVIKVKLKPKLRSVSESPPSPIVSLAESPSENSRGSVSSSESRNVSSSKYQRSIEALVHVHVASDHDGRQQESDSDHNSVSSTATVGSRASSEINKSTHARAFSKSKPPVKSGTPNESPVIEPKLNPAKKKSATNVIHACHLSILLDILIDYAHKWKAIGIVLGFSPNELQGIEAKPFLLPGAPNSWLTEMLSRWIQWSPETQHRKYATLEDLVKALKSKTVGLAAVAEEIKIAVAETHSTSNPSGQTDQSKLSSKSLIKNDSKIAIEFELIPPDPSAPPLDHYAFYLRSCFTYSREPADKWPQIEAREYIHLAVVSNEYYNRKDLEEFRKATLHGSIDDILKSKAPIDFSDLLKQNHVKGKRYVIKRILLEGAPGVGKSTISWEICRKWGNGELFQEYSLVVLIRFRDPWVRKVQNISDLFRFPGEPKMQRKIARQINRTQGKGLLLILEGFDEAPPALRKTDSLFFELFKCSLLPNATVMVTTRPSASYDLQRCCKGESSRRIEVLGFGEKEINEYIESAFVESALEEKEDFHKYLELYPHIYSMMYVPLNSAIVTHVYQSCKSSSTIVPKTMTQLYTALVKTMLLRYMMELPEYEDNDINNFSDLPKPILENFTEVCKLAYQGMTKPETQIIFSRLPKAFNSLGLMQSVPELYIDKGASVSHNFLHLTIQEFLAAYHLCQLSEEEQGTFLIENFLSHYWEKQKLEMVSRFLAGLCPSLVSKVVASKNHTDSYSEWFVSKARLCLLFELQYPHFLSDIFGSHQILSDNYILNSTTHNIFEQDKKDLEWENPYSICLPYSAFEYYALGYCIGCPSSCQWKIRLKDFTEMFIKGILSSLQQCGNDITSFDVTHLQHVSIKDTDCEQLAEFVTHFPQLQELELKVKSRRSVSKLIRNLPNSIISLSIFMTEPLCEESYEAIADLLSSPNHSLKNLNIRASDELIWQYLIDGLSQNTSLEGLRIHAEANSVSISAVLQEPLLKKYNHLVSLHLESCELKDYDAIALCEVLRGNSKLTILHLGTNTIGNDGAIALAKALETNSSLESLSLYKNNIGNEGAAAIAHMLTVDNSTLINLDLRCNKLEDEGVMMLLDSVRLHNTTMKMLKLQNPKYPWDNEKFESPPDCDRIQLSPTFCKRHPSIVPPKPQDFLSRILSLESQVFPSSNPDQTHTDSDSGTDYEDID